jgi:hypothetical protein
VLGFVDDLTQMFINNDSRHRFWKHQVGAEVAGGMVNAMRDKDWHTKTQKSFRDAACNAAWCDYLMARITPAYTLAEMIQNATNDKYQIIDIEGALALLHLPAAAPLWAAWCATEKQWKSFALQSK